MAAGGYYGFAGRAVAGPQYSAQPAPAYSHPPVAAAYALQQMPGVEQGAAPAYPPTAPPARPVAPAAYRGYPPASTQDYGYGAWPPESGPQPAVTQNYQDGYSYGCSSTSGSYEAKPYYQPSATQHASTDPYYHSNSQGGYNNPPVTTYSQSQPQRHLVPIKPVQTTNAASSSYSAYPAISTSQQSLPPPSIQTYTPSSSYAPAAPAYTSSPASYAGSNYSTYDTAGYTAANVPHYQPSQQPLLPPPPQQPPQQVTPGWGGAGGASAAAASSYNQKPPFPAKPQKPKPSPKQPQLHYCDICKISCAGPQTYREHLEGQKHKKKEAALKTGGPAGGAGPRGIHPQLHCELCVISCTGVDAYAAHIQGAKHQKVLKLHAKLGKPIPSSKPALVNVSLAPANGLASKQAPEASPMSSKPARSVVGAAKCAGASKMAKKAPASNLAFTGLPKHPESGTEPEKSKTAPPKPDTQAHEQPAPDGSRDGTIEALDIQPVGHDYVEEVLNDKGEMVHFRCKLCECNFNDPNAKDMHLKGYRHRLQYKKKVDPDLPVEIKPSSRARKMQEEKLKRQQLRALARRRQVEQQRWHLEMRRYEQEMYWRRVEEEELYWAEQQRRHLAEDWHLPRLMGRPIPPLLPGRRPSSSDDWHVMAKHSGIYPTEEELQGIQKAVSHSEEALRLVSDLLTKQEEGKTGDNSNEKGKAAVRPQLLKGVKRVGVLAKGLLLRGDRKVRLILISTQKPTRALLGSIAEELPRQLEKVTSDPYEVVPDGEEGCLVVASCKEPRIQVTVSLTSPLMREEEEEDEVPSEAGAPSETQVNSSEILNKEKCLESLAALRHAKWFQVRANGLQSCVIVLRVLRDLCQRVPTWGALPGWAMEILVEKALSSAAGPLGPGEAVRRVLEFVAAGMLLADGPGLQDPCEREAADALQGLSQQQREDLTASAQHALRMFAFRQIHKVLGMEALPKTHPGGHSRKRRWGADEEMEGEGDGKKDKKKDAEDEPGT